MLTVTMWEPAYQIKAGVRRKEGYIDDRGRFKEAGSYRFPVEIGQGVFRTEEEARVVAEQRRMARIASLERQLTKLKSLSPSLV